MEFDKTKEKLLILGILNQYEIKRDECSQNLYGKINRLE